jgi:hypothetical protein
VSEEGILLEYSSHGFSARRRRKPMSKNPRIDKRDLDTNIGDTLPAHANAGREKAKARTHGHTHACVSDVTRCDADKNNRIS